MKENKDEPTTQVVETPEQWLERINQEAEKKADEISTILKCKIEPFVFVVEELKDAAVGFMRVPDAVQSLKIFRTMIENQDLGAQLAARSQLVRDADIAAAGMKGNASDSRFMDASGKYDPENNGLNFSLLLQGQKVIKLYTDKFKKK